MRKLSDKIEDVSAILTKAISTLDDISRNERHDLGIPDKLERLTRWNQDILRQARTADRKKTVSVFGAFSTGKTTFLNALLRLLDYGERLHLPERIEPTTALPVRLSHDPDLTAGEMSGQILYLDGRAVNMPIADVLKIMDSAFESTEHNNIEELRISLFAPPLDSYDFLDLPGLRTAFFQSHQHIVDSRLHDSAVIAWVHGGIDQEFPTRAEKNKISELKKAKRHCIAVWNAKQDESEITLESKCEADAQLQKLKDQIGDIIEDEDIVILWCRQASEGNITEETGITQFMNRLENMVLSVLSPVDVAEEAVYERIRDSIDLLNQTRGSLRELVELQEIEKKQISRCIAEVYDITDTTEELIAQGALNAANDACSSKIEPVLRDFINSESSLGGLIKTAWDSAVSKSHKHDSSFSQRIEQAVANRLQSVMNIGGDNNGWFHKFIREHTERIARRINAEWKLFANSDKIARLNIKNQPRLPFGSIASDSPDFSALVNSMVNDIQARLASIVGTMITTVITTLLLILSPKTGTALDIVVGLGALATFGFMLSTIQNKMLGQVKSAAWEIGLHIRRIIQEVLNSYNQTCAAGWLTALDDDGAQRHRDRTLKCLDSIQNIIGQLRASDVRGKSS